ncbi:CBL-interacting protein kinase 32-like isoform X2 [Papaver somniferum]|uniref:CBL-interacting protein kinase 32-like isoform X2 n=1 Tax=Papaver somniferum TaxID=3469 RepID=UPI000E705B60|nr:CBL-interacting protein kinase 32-like isoform X2 [Papaver somniferum]
MSTSKVMRLVGKYELGRTIGEGTFAKVKFAKNSETGEPVAIKILDKEKVLKHKMAEQIRREISTMKLIKHPYVVQLYEVMGSKTKIFIVLEFVTGGELFEKVPENLLLDVCGNLKISDFGLSALSQQVKEDGLLHTSCGTPNYVAPEVLKDRGYDGAAADLWSCGVILFVLLAGYLPFDDSNLMVLYKKISAAEYIYPPWISFGALRLITRILDPNPTTRITVPEILNDEWFRKGFKRPVFQEIDDINLGDVEAVFKGPEGTPINQIRAKKEEQPVAMNAFELISLSRGLNLGNLFEVEQSEIKRETRFTSKCPANEIICKIEEAAKPLGFDVHKNNYKMDLENVNAGRKGKLKVSTEVFQMAPSLHMVEVRKKKGDTLEFLKFYKKIATQLKDVVWKSEEDMQNGGKG